MSVRLSIWRAERVSANRFRLYRGNALAGVVEYGYGPASRCFRVLPPDEPAWYAVANRDNPRFAGRKGSRIGRETARKAAWHYFGADAGLAIEDAVAIEPFLGQFERL